MKRKFEEILEECLSAQLEGRRSVEESLSLYPSLARELEPLLRTAENVSFAFEKLDPPAHLVDRGRLRFIAASLEERRVRQITRGVRGFDRPRLSWGFTHWSLLGSGVAAAVGILLLGAVILVTGGSSDSDDSFARDPSPSRSAESASFTASLVEFKAQLNRVKLRALEGRISPGDLEILREATSELAGSGRPPDDESRQAVEEALKEQYAFVADLAGDLPPEQVPQVADVLLTTQKAANDLGIAIFSPPAPSGLPGLTPTPAASPSPTESPAPTGASQTPTPTQAPQPTPTPPASTGD